MTDIVDRLLKFSMMMRYKLEERQSEVIALYNSGLNTGELSRLFAVKPLAVRRFLKRNGIELRGREYKLAGSEKSIVCDYQAGVSISSIARKHESNPSSILSRLKNSGVHTKIKTGYRTYTVNESYFDKIDSEDKAYFLGLLYADGCCTPRLNRVSINLHEKDAYILERLKEHLGFSGPIRHRPTKTGAQYVLTIQSERFTKRAVEVGIRHRKTFDLDFPGWIDKTLVHHFIRGFFDGDGTVGIYCSKGWVSYSFGFIGYVGFIEPLRAHLQGLGIPTYQHSDKRSDPRTIVIRHTSRVAALAFAKYIYKDATLFLTRKKAIFDSIPVEVSVKSRLIKFCSHCNRSQVYKRGYCSTHYYEFVSKERMREYYQTTGKEKRSLRGQQRNSLNDT